MSSSNTSLLLLTCLVVASTIFLPPNAYSQTYTFTSTDVPGAISTICLDINNAGAVIGYYTDPSGAEHGFLLRDGAFSTINFAYDTSTYPWGINDLGQIVGWGFDFDGGGPQGFMVSGGKVTMIEDPDGYNTNLFSITNSGVIVGSYFNGTTYVGLTDSGGTFTNIDAPDADGTEVYGINREGWLVGVALNREGAPRGFLDKDGEFTGLSFPGALDTVAYRINDKGEVAGQYEGQSGVINGYAWGAGVFTTVTFPESTETSVNGLNNAGTLVGSYTDASGATHGFIATPQP